VPSQLSNPGPRYAPQPFTPCPTCSATATASATLNARLAELSGQVAALKVALRDKENAANRSQQLADQRGSRIAELVAQGNQAAQLIVSLRKELTEANETGQQMSDFLDTIRK
jgi:chromosome segregation ATPase